MDQGAMVSDQCPQLNKGVRGAALYWNAESERDIEDIFDSKFSVVEPASPVLTSRTRGSTIANASDRQRAPARLLRRKIPLALQGVSSPCGPVLG